MRFFIISIAVLLLFSCSKKQETTEQKPAPHFSEYQYMQNMQNKQTGEMWHIELSLQLPDSLKDLRKAIVSQIFSITSDSLTDKTLVERFLQNNDTLALYKAFADYYVANAEPIAGIKPDYESLCQYIEKKDGNTEDIKTVHVAVSEYMYTPSFASYNICFTSTDEGYIPRYKSVNYDRTKNCVLSADDMFDQTKIRAVLRGAATIQSNDLPEIHDVITTKAFCYNFKKDTLYAYPTTTTLPTTIVLPLKKYVGAIEAMSPNAKKILRQSLSKETESQLAKSRQFVSTFYSTYVLLTSDMGPAAPPPAFSDVTVENNCTPKVLRILSEQYDYDCPERICFSTAPFRTYANEGISVKIITYILGVHSVTKDWLVIDYSDKGYFGTTAIKVADYDSKLMIDDFRFLGNPVPQYWVTQGMLMQFASVISKY
ncbi:MAG: hypothetical protein HUK08_02420 [Bacteroidaceae bacterium]|nr:hypothetical protein [Bacteroidaceae bacterium]